MAAQLLGKSKGAKHPLPTYFPPNRGEKIACSMGSSFSFSLCQSWGLLSPPGLENQGKSSTRLGLAFSSHFFFFFPLPYLTISPAAMGWKSSAFPEKEPLELAHQAEAEPSREVFFVASRSPRQGSASSREAPRLGCMLLRCFSLFKSKSNRSSKPPLMSSFPPLRCRDARPSKRAEHPPPHPCARAFPSLEASCGM